MWDFAYSKGVAQGQKPSARMELWGGIIADSINQKPIYLLVDGRMLELEPGTVYMDDMLNLMLPVSMIKNNFNCSSYVQNGTTLVMEQGDVSVSMNMGEYTMKLNGVYENLSAPMVEHEEELYIPVQALEKGLGCQYMWDISTNSASIINVDAAGRRLPVFYDYRAVNRDPQVKNQGELGTCWAFAALTALEASLLPEEEMDFSEDHMTLHNSFSFTQDEGGEYTMAMAYLTAWQGPVFEKDDPYGDGESPDGLEAVKHVQEIQILEGKNYDRIKEMVFKYGGVQSSLYMPLSNPSSDSEYYNAEEYAYCYIGTEKPNHDVVIIGWDDNYPKENFNLNLEANGAFICRNSWGESFADNGTFYISYYDTNIGIHNVVYTGIEDSDNYDTIYQADLCGWVGLLGYGKESGFFSNVYTAEEEETLEAVGFYATDKDTEYEIYVVHDFEDTYSFKEKQLLKTGKFTNAGYYTVPVKKEVQLKAGERFAVVVKVTTPNAQRPIAIEYAADKATESVDLSDGEGYMSLYGNVWESAEEKNCNICLKAYTNRR
ncbi:MAG: cell surface protein [Lachnospiraceae bacterium]|nr:cell surface protein [Lachnospiraceae bacterium]